MNNPVYCLIFFLNFFSGQPVGLKWKMFSNGRRHMFFCAREELHPKNLYPTYICDFCKHPELSRRDLKNHMISFHQKNMPRSCLLVKKFDIWIDTDAESSFDGSDNDEELSAEMNNRVFQGLLSVYNRLISFRRLIDFW